MTRHRDVRRRWPLVVVLVSVPAMLWLEAGQPYPGGHGAFALGLCVPLVLVVFLVWRQRVRLRGDRAADERLQVLLDRTCLPDVELLCVIGTQWHGPAGQCADAVDVATGRSARQWFSLADFADGSLVLVRREPSGSRILDWIAPAEVAAAFRHRARRARVNGHGGLAGRVRSRRGRARLIAEVEQALKRGDAEAATWAPRRVYSRRRARAQRPMRWTP